MPALPITNILARASIQEVDKYRGHKFSPPKHILQGIPALYSQEQRPIQEQDVWIHYFYGPCDWYILEYDPETGIGFGYASLGYGYELGSISLIELGELRTGLACIERELDWQPTPVSQISALTDN